MKNIFRHLLLLVVGCLWLFVGNHCLSINKGIAVGNPELEGKSVRVVPENGNEVYLAAILDDKSVDVSLFQNNEGSALKKANQGVSFVLTKASALVETVRVGYDQTDNQVNIEASFSNGRALLLVLNLNTANEVTSVDLEVDSAPVAASFDVQSSSTGCETGSQNAARILVETACSRIVACHAQIFCSECNAAVLGIPVDDSLSSTTLAQLEAAVTQGTVTVAQTSLSQCTAELSALTCQDLSSFSTIQNIRAIPSLKSLIPSAQTSCSTVFQ